MNSETVLIYTLGFFIYFNIKVVLFFAFFNHAKKIVRQKNNPNTKKTEISEAKLREWFENSTFKKISKIEYSEELARLMFSVNKSHHFSPPAVKPKAKKTTEKIQIGDLTILSGITPKNIIISATGKKDSQSSKNNKIRENKINKKLIKM